MSEPAPDTDRPTHARWIVPGLVLGIVVSLEFPFEIRGSRVHVRFTDTSAGLIAPDGTRARYLFGEC